jgi:nuclear transport factor 2 (NTF2) superfamily protein
LTDRPPLPPFTAETAAQKVQGAEDAWNTRDPERVSFAYSEDSVWRNRDALMRIETPGRYAMVCSRVSSYSQASERPNWLALARARA